MHTGVHTVVVLVYNTDNIERIHNEDTQELVKT